MWSTVLAVSLLYNTQSVVTDHVLHRMVNGLVRETAADYRRRRSIPERSLWISP